MRIWGLFPCSRSTATWCSGAILDFAVTMTYVLITLSFKRLYIQISTVDQFLNFVPYFFWKSLPDVVASFFILFYFIFKLCITEALAINTFVYYLVCLINFETFKSCESKILLLVFFYYY